MGPGMISINLTGKENAAGLKDGMVKIYRPKSFLFFLLCGFFFVALPLIAALVSTEVFMSRLAKLNPLEALQLERK